MINRPFSTVLARVGLVAAILATLLILAPVALAAEELEYEEGGTDPVATFSATDEDGDAIEWSLTGDDASKFKISDDGVLEFKDSPNYEGPADADKNNLYLVTVNASETSDPLDLEITVTDKDEDGKVSLTQPQPQVGRGLVASLSDQDADVEDEKWQWARGESADGPWTDIDRATSASRSPVADDLDMYLRATVVYDDKFGEGKTASAVTENSVEDRTRANAAPSFSSLDETTGEAAETPNVIVVTRDVAERVKGANVGKPITASDANNDVLLYTIDTGSKASFTIDSRSGQLKTKVKTLVSDNDGYVGDFDGNGTIDGDEPEVTMPVTVTATDPSGASTDQLVTVTIVDVNDAPKFAKYSPAAGDAQNVHNATALTVVEGTRSLDRTPQTATATEIDDATYLAADVDDGDGPVAVVGVANSTLAVVALTYEVTGPDASAFVSPIMPDTVNGDAGVATLAFKGTHKVDFEAKDEYEITIVASDENAPDGIGTVDVTISVVNAEDTGVVTPTQREPQVGKVVVASLADQDGDLRGQKWQWYRHVVADDPDTDTDEETDLSADNIPECGATTTDPCRIKGATSPNYTPVTADQAPLDEDTDDLTDREDRRLAARVTYTDACARVDTTEDPPVCVTPGAGETDASDSMQVVLQAAVEVEDPANTAPKFRDDQDANTPGDQADAERSVPENVKGASVGDPVTASDADLLIYSLSGADAASFTVDSGLKAKDTPGQIKTAEKLDYETKDMYMVVVTATDPSGATDTINVMIGVTDEDDKTVVTIVDEMSGKIDYEEGGTAPVATLSAMDQDGDAIDWSLAGDDAGKFKISDDGVLEFKDSPNYEGPADADKNNLYLVTVNASETSDPLDLEITVTDKDEDGKVSLTQPQPQVGRGLVASLSDQDADVEDEKWQWARGESADGPWTDIDRATSASRSPVADDLDMYLRATVVYDDKFGEGKTASAVTESSVEDRTRANAAPSFEGLDETGPTVDDQNEADDPAGIQDDIIVTRDVAERVKGANVGKPITASDANNDVLLYTIDTGSKASFTIDSRSGQLKTKVDTLVSDNDGLTGDDDGGDIGDTTAGEITMPVTVTASDPSGASTDQVVTVTIVDVNDAPKFAKYAPTADTPQPHNAIALTVVEPTRVLDRTPQTATATEIDDATYLAADADAGDGPVAVAGAVDTDGTTTTRAVVALTYEVTGPDASAFVSPIMPDTVNGDAGVATLAFKGTHKVDFEAKDEYEITIVASDENAPDGIGTVDVTISVVNAEDTGVVTPTQREPQVGKVVVASLADQDGDLRGQKWQWYRHVVADDPDTDTDEETDLSADNIPECGATTTDPCRIKGATSPNYTPVTADQAPLDEDTDDLTDRLDRRLAARVTYTDAYVTDTDTPADGDDGDSMHVVLQAPVEVEDPANTAPKFRDDQDANTPGDQADAERSVPENVKGASVGDPVTASDADLLIYSLSGADAASFTVDSGLKAKDTPGQIKTAEKLDYETKDMYMVVVTATDPSGATDTINVNIEVIDEDDKTVVVLNAPPAFDSDTAEMMVEENLAAGTAVGSVTATDADDDPITYTDDSMYFDVDDMGNITTTMMLDYEAMPSHTVTVTATDGIGSNSIEVTITVIDNTPPAFDADTPTEMEVEENQDEGAVVGSVTATDVDGDTIEYGLDSEYFAVDASGQITTTMSLDYEAMASHAVTVTASDDEGEDTVEVTIMVIDNTPPAFASDTAERSVDEKRQAGLNVGDPVTATDAEGDTVTYSLSDSEYFTIDGASGQITTAMSLDYEAMASHTVTVTASNGEGEGSIEVTIMVIENTPPAFPADTATRSVDENMDAGTAVGEPVIAADDDAGETVTYSLEGSDYFMIDASTGQITTTMMLDYEAMTSHMVTVTATDTPGDTDSVEVTINVNNAHTGCDTAGNMGLVNDCEALLDSKDALGGSLNWTYHTQTPMSDWIGVIMSGDPMRVTAIDLRDQGLDGTIPSALGRVSMLTSLNLRSNEDLSGEIPGSLNYLSNLTVLNLHSNSHTGGIPDLSGTSLVELFLPGNDLTGEVPAWLNTMTDMTELWLWGNNLSGAMPDLSGMTSLDKLKLNGNSDLTGIDAAMLPSSLKWLIAGQTDVGATAPDLSGTSLTTLWLNETGLSGAIPVASIPTSVTSLNLKDNSLSGDIPDMSGLDNLRYLRLHRNELSGDIPGTLGDMASIERIWLYDNGLTGIAAGLANAADTLTHLYLNGNSFAEGTCLPGDLADVANNDFEAAGLEACQ